MSESCFAAILRRDASPLCFSFLCLFLLGGCTARYVYTPTIAQRALDPNIQMEGLDKEKPIAKTTGFKITDADVFAFTNDVKQAWRNRSQASRTLGVLTGVSRVGLAGAATMVAATSPAGAASDAVPVLTGIATFIGEIFGIVDPGGRSEAYQDGLKLLLDAEAEYLLALPPGAKGAVTGTELTVAGATLFKRVNAAITVVDKALQSRVQTQDEVDRATAKFKPEEKPVPPGESSGAPPK